MRKVCAALAAVLSLGVGMGMVVAPAHAHEVTDNRATLVLRDGGHLSLTLYLDYVAALHLALAPGRPLEEFMLTYAAMPAAEFEAAQAGAHRKFEQGVGVVLKAGTALTFQGWQWPQAAQVQQDLRTRAMQLLRRPGAAHSHAAPLEVRAELAAVQDFQSLTIRFPTELGKVLVVSYKPNQAWSDPTKPPPEINF